eukprot:3835587-Amphidinium_carterae.1
MDEVTRASWSSSIVEEPVPESPEVHIIEEQPSEPAAGERLAPAQPSRGKRKAMVESVGVVAEDAAGWLLPGCEASSSSTAPTPMVEDQEAGNTASDDMQQYTYRISRAVSGGVPHPDWLTEPAAVGGIKLPKLSATEVLKLPARVGHDGSLSSPQLESVAFAAKRFRSVLPSGARAGYYLGDGTGCGKGRVAAALIWH